MGKRLTLREALASDRLDDFVRQEELRGAEPAKGSDFERALALLITQRRSEDRTSRSHLAMVRARRVTPIDSGPLQEPGPRWRNTHEMGGVGFGRRPLTSHFYLTRYPSGKGAGFRITG